MHGTEVLAQTLKPMRIYFIKIQIATVLLPKKMQAYRTMSQSGKTVIDLIDVEHKKQVAENRHYLKTICEVLR